MQTDALIIRRVKPADAAQLHERCYLGNNVAQAEEAVAESVRQAEEGTHLQLVAELDGCVVGTVILKRQAHPLFAHRVEVEGLVVAADCWRQGIARRLVEECTRQARSWGARILEISCRAGEPPEQVYPRLGFIEHGRLPGGIVEPWGDRRSYDLVLYHMPLE